MLVSFKDKTPGSQHRSQRGFLQYRPVKYFLLHIVWTETAAETKTRDSEIFSLYITKFLTFTSFRRFLTCVSSFILQGSVTGVAQQSERTSSGLRARGDQGLLQTRLQGDKDMSHCRGGLALDVCLQRRFSNCNSRLRAQRAGKVTSEPPESIRFSLTSAGVAVFFFLFCQRPCRSPVAPVQSRCACYSSRSQCKPGRALTKDFLMGG